MHRYFPDSFMLTPSDPAMEAIFTPLADDGGFSPNIARYLCELGQARPSVVLAFPPKAAGTYLRSAAISAVGGQLVRTVQAQGGRDATSYLPTFILYYTRGIPHPRPHAGAGCEPGVFLRQHWT